MDETPYQPIDASSLIDLKTELYKKQEALKLAKTRNDSGSIKRKGLKLKGEEVHKKIKNASRPISNVKVVNEQEEEALKKSKLALERKAKLYEQILSKKVSLDDEEDELYMVDFRRKMLKNENEPTSISKNHYEDKDDPEKHTPVPSAPEKLIKRYEDFFFVAASTNMDETKSSTKFPHENESNKDGPVHYQNVQYDEVRDHGVGYYAFSTDEEKRKEQMDLLNTLRQETGKKQAAFKNIEQKRKSALQARLAKICERRNIDKSAIGNLIPKSDDDPSTEANQMPIDIDISNIPLPDGDAVCMVPPPKPVVRPWDEGKDVFGLQVSSQRSRKDTQKDWMEERRSERLDEFAPPLYF